MDIIGDSIESPRSNGQDAKQASKDAALLDEELSKIFLKLLGGTERLCLMIHA